MRRRYSRRVISLASNKATAFLESILVQRSRNGRDVGHRSRAYVHESLRRLHNEAMHTYSPPAYPGPVHIFCAEKQERGAKTDKCLGWGKILRGEIEPHSVPGFRQTMMEEPNVEVLAEMLRMLVERNSEFQL
jgi:thioesterase domain-containing protein